MLLEMSIIPVGEGSHLSDLIAEAFEIVAASELRYRLTPSGTCIEGEWDEVMTVVHQCHEHVRRKAPHVFTILKIEEEAGVTNKMADNISSIKSKVGAPITNT